MSLRQTSNKVEGSYDDGRGSAGTIRGTVDGNKLTYVWNERGRNGTGFFTLSRDGNRMSGTYSEEGQPDNNWSGSRKH